MKPAQTKRLREKAPKADASRLENAVRALDASRGKLHDSDENAFSTLGAPDSATSNRTASAL